MDQVLLDEFFAECGLVDPYRMVVSLKGDAATQTYEFRQPFLVVGRRADSDLFLDHWLVSRRHTYLQVVEGRFCCVDLGSRTGTHGGDATERTGWLSLDRPIQIGPYAVLPELPTDEERDYPPLPIVTWSLVNPAEPIPQQWTMNRGLILVGRSPSCRIRLPGEGVSRFHAGLVLTMRGVWAVDLLSQKTLLVNGQPRRFALVEPGDQLQIGSHRLTPHYDLSLVQAARRKPNFAPVERASFTDLTDLKIAPSEASSHPVKHDQLPALTPTVLVPSEFWGNRPEVLAITTGDDRIDATVSIVMQQVGAMQQQMFDQYHQTMMMMFERFVDLHRETSATMRSEIDEVRKLSDEIDSLRSETARLAEATTLTMQQAALDQSALPPAPSPSPASARPARSVPPPNPVTAEPPTKKVPPLPDPHSDIHAQLCNRLNRIEAERQTRWQKIFAMMTTKS